MTDKQTIFSFARPALPTSTFAADGDAADYCDEGLTVVDLCCGCGMSSLGFKAAGFEILGGRGCLV